MEPDKDEEITALRHKVREQAEEIELLRSKAPAILNAIKRRETLRCQLRDALSELAELEALLKDMQPEVENLFIEPVE